MSECTERSEGRERMRKEAQHESHASDRKAHHEI